nr:hypothetical protein [uncultured Desulfobulbus sp.]
MEAMERLEKTLDNGVREANNQVERVTRLLHNRVRIIAELLQQDIIDNGSGRGVCLGAVLNETVDEIEEQLDGFVDAVEKFKEPCVEQVKSLHFDHRESLSLLGRIAQEGKTSLIQPNKRIVS